MIFDVFQKWRIYFISRKEAESMTPQATAVLKSIAYYYDIICAKQKFWYYFYTTK